VAFPLVNNNRKIGSDPTSWLHLMRLRFIIFMIMVRYISHIICLKFLRTFYDRPFSFRGTLKRTFYARIGSPPLELHLDRSVTAANTDSAAGSPTSVAASSSHLTYSPASLQLFANLSSFPL